MKIKIELETDEEKTKLSSLLPPEASTDGLVITDFPAARGLTMYIKGMRPQDRAEQIKKSYEFQKSLKVGK